MHGTPAYASALTDITLTTLPGDLGQTREEADSSGQTCHYRLYQMHTVLINDALAANEVVGFVSFGIVTNDISATVDGANEPRAVGVATAAIPESTATTTYYGWIQTGGPDTIKTNGDDDIAAGDYLIADASNDGCCDSLSTVGALTIVSPTITAVTVTAVTITAADITVTAVATLGTNTKTAVTSGINVLRDEAHEAFSILRSKVVSAVNVLDANACGAISNIHASVNNAISAVISSVKANVDTLMNQVDQDIEDCARVFAVALAADVNSANTVAALLLID
jgi:hypothetical protein